MPRAEVGTPKYLANAMKSKGLQRLRWYCQVCEKQCRDENGFKCHVTSEGHLRQMLVVGENAGRHISDFSSQFQHEFVQLLSRRFGTKRVKANQVYQEYIQDKHHLHMNSTRWVTLTEFCKHLGREGIARVDETEKGWFIAWIDSSPKALAKAEANLKKERATMSDEQRERLLISEQIARAAEASSSVTPPDESSPPAGLQREEGDAPVKLSFALKKKLSPDPSDAIMSTPIDQPVTVSTPAPIKLTPKVNPLKANVFKMAKSSFNSSIPSASKREREAVPVALRLIEEEQERKRRKMDREGTKIST